MEQGYDIRSPIVQHPNTPPDVLIIFEALNPQTFSEQLRQLAQHHGLENRSIAAQNPSAIADLL